MRWPWRKRPTELPSEAESILRCADEIIERLNAAADRAEARATQETSTDDD